MGESRFVSGGWFAAFPSRTALGEAIDRLQAHEIAAIEAYLPWDEAPLVAKVTGAGSRLPRLVFVGAVVGAVLAYGIQWWANAVSYPLDIGGRPAHAVVSFIVPTFEGAVLAAAFTAFLGVLLGIGLPALWHPVFELDGFEQVSRDTWWLAVDARDPAVDPETIAATLEDAGAIRVQRVEGPR